MELVRLVRRKCGSVLSVIIAISLVMFSILPARAEDQTDITAPVFVAGSQSPADNSTTDNVLVPISGTFSDSESGLDNTSVDLVINDLPCPAGDVTLDGGTFTYTPVFAYDDSIVTVAVAMADLAGNLSDVISWSFTIASPPINLVATAEGGTVVSNYVNATNSALAISGNVPADSQGIQTVEFYLDDQTFTEPFRTLVLSNITGFAAATVSTQFAQLVSNQGERGLTARRIGASGNLSIFGPQTTVTIDTINPEGSISINSGSATTNLTNVNLDLSATDTSGVTQMALSNDNLTYSAWQEFASTLNYTLPEGDGLKTVYVKFMDAAGNISAPFSAAITLNMAPVTTDDAPTAWSKDSVTVTLSVASIANPPATTYYSTDGSTPSILYTGPFTLTTEGTYQLKYYSIDNTGNTEEVKIGTLVRIDTHAPSLLPSSSVIEDMDSDSSDDDFTNNKQIRLAWPSGTDPLSGVDHYLLRIKRGSTSGTNIVNDFDTGNVNSYTLTADQAALLNEDKFYLAIAVVDEAGNASSYRNSDGITIDLTAPNIVLNDSSTITVEKGSSYTDAGATWIDTIDGTGSVAATGTVDVNTVGTYLLYYSYTDRAGNTSEVLPRTVYVVDSTVPSIPTIDPITSVQRTSVTISGTAEVGDTINLSLTSGITISDTGMVDDLGVWSKTIDISALNDGIVAVSATAINSTGRESLPATTTFTKDTTAPVFSTPTANPVNRTTQTTVIILFSASEDLVSDPTVTIDGKSASFSSKSGLNYIYAYTVADIDSEGTKTISIEGTDPAGNSGLASGTTTFDFTAPAAGSETITIGDPEHPRRPTVQVVLNDSLSGINAAMAVMRINGVAVKTAFDPTTGTLTFAPLRDMAPRTYYVAIDVKDNVGNSAVRYSFTFTVSL